MTEFEPLAAIASVLSRTYPYTPLRIAKAEKRIKDLLSHIPLDSRVIALSQKNQDRVIQARREAAAAGASALIALIDRVLALAGVAPEPHTETPQNTDNIDYSKLLD
jgi:hypothetical protein